MSEDLDKVERQNTLSNGEQSLELLKQQFRHGKISQKTVQDLAKLGDKDAQTLLIKSDLDVVPLKQDIENIDDLIEWENQLFCDNSFENNLYDYSAVSLLEGSLHLIEGFSREKQFILNCTKLYKIFFKGGKGSVPDKEQVENIKLFAGYIDSNLHQENDIYNAQEWSIVSLCLRLNEYIMDSLFSFAEDRETDWKKEAICVELIVRIELIWKHPNTINRYSGDTDKVIQKLHQKRIGILIEYLYSEENYQKDLQDDVRSAVSDILTSASEFL